MLAGLGRGRSDLRNVSESFYRLKIISSVSWEPRMEYLFNCTPGRSPINLPSVPDVELCSRKEHLNKYFKNFNVFYKQWSINYFLQRMHCLLKHKIL
jgi:hypothetical protein